MKEWKKKCILFLVSQNISLFGSSVVGYAITWYITLKTSSGMWMTASILCSLLPQLFISLFAGVWADRYHRKMLIMVSDGFIAASTLGLALMFLVGKDSMWMLMLVSAVRSVGAGVQTPAVGAIVPQIIPQEKLTRINGINQTCNSVLMMISPAVGGVLLGSVGIAWAMLVDVITAALGVFEGGKARKQRPGFHVEGIERRNSIYHRPCHCIQDTDFLRNCLLSYNSRCLFNASYD